MAMILHLNKVAHFILVITSIIQVKVLVPITIGKSIPEEYCVLTEPNDFDDSLIPHKDLNGLYGASLLVILFFVSLFYC